ncbi:MAG: DMT family transporter [Bacteroidales bacterium]|nr:DMT family transporter [Bacteroidales bacterium]
MKHQHTKANLVLLLTALIWGLAFVAQRAGMKSMGPFAFNGIRFALGALSLLPLLWIQRFKKSTSSRKTLYTGGIITGLFLFAGSSFQQIGMVYTTAGNGGFITSLYVVLVPVLGLFWKQKVKIQTWSGALIALIGLYFLTVHEHLSLAFGDLLVLVSAFFFAAHVLVIGHFAPKTNILKLSVIQFTISAALSLIISAFTENTSWESVQITAIPLLYGGILSVGVAYTLQVFGQRNTPPAHAAIILSFESLFAAIGGIILLNEPISVQIAIGGLLMLTGAILSQIEKLPFSFRNQS